MDVRTAESVFSGGPKVVGRLRNVGAERNGSVGNEEGSCDSDGDDET